MKAIAYRRGSSADESDALYDIDIACPEPGPYELLVRVMAVSVNPLDTKVRQGLVQVPHSVNVLGWDASGIVEAVGSAVKLFKPGDTVFYAGSFHLSGSNAEFHLIDERIAGPKPQGLGFDEAAALPLAALTAWGLLFERLGVALQKPSDGTARDQTESLLIVGGAGGVGSMLIQLARRLTKLTVIATASHEASQDWCRALGAHHVINHNQSLVDQIRALEVPGITHIASLTHTAQHLPQLVELIEPHGKLGLIDDHVTFDAASLKAKSLSLHWEMVFTRPLFGTIDLIAQHRILKRVAALVDEGVIRTTLSRSFTPINARSLIDAHRLVEAGGTVGKVVVAHEAGLTYNSSYSVNALSKPS